MSAWPLLLLVACGDPASKPDTPAPADAPTPADAAATGPSEEAPAPLPDPSEPRYAATHVLIAWAGAANAPPSVTRAEGEARALAEDLRRRALSGEDLSDLAREHSDGPSGPRGGALGVYATGTMVPAFERAVASVEEGAIAPLVETPFGYHVVRRDPVVEGRFSHLLVTWDGAWRSGSDRSQDEARERIAQALARLRAGEDFAAVARELSDDPSAAQGGDLGRVAPGQMVPAFDDAAFALSPGEFSDVVTTPYGFHVIRRER